MWDSCEKLDNEGSPEEAVTRQQSPDGPAGPAAGNTGRPHPGRGRSSVLIVALDRMLPLGYALQCMAQRRLHDMIPSIEAVEMGLGDKR